ncbi:MAG TPA: hypothetical protein VFK52_03170 [Nocardioidaceae bacterium]|nr:hypothetical protein [Nocardioidaceae bacterium]
MRSHIRNNVVGYLALVVALSGTSYAAVQLSAGQVQTKHLANNAVTTKKVKNGTVRAVDLKAGVVKNGAVLLAQGGVDETGTMDTTSGQIEFVMPRAGRVYVRNFLGATYVNCSLGLAEAGLYVDGEPVPGSFHSVPSEAMGEQAREFVGTLTLSKGTHTVERGTICAIGDHNGELGNNETWTVLLVG